MKYTVRKFYEFMGESNMFCSEKDAEIIEEFPCD